MDSERLRKLKQQRQIILEHLDWINQEIDQATITTPKATSPKTSRLIEAIDEDREVSSSFEIESTPPNHVVSDLYDELGPDTKSAVAETKRGCLIIGSLAFAAFAALCAWVLYYY